MRIIFLIAIVISLIIGWYVGESLFKDAFPKKSYEKAIQYVNACDYQIEIVEDSMIIWDGRRYVGTLPIWDNSPLDSLLQKDNE